MCYETDRKNNYAQHINTKKHRQCIASSTNQKVLNEANTIKTSSNSSSHRRPLLRRRCHQLPLDPVKIATGDKNIIISNDSDDISMHSTDAPSDSINNIIKKNNENLENNNIKHICNFCQTSFARKDILARHLKYSCQRKKYVMDDIEKDKTNSNIINNLITNDDIIKLKDQQIEILKKENEHLKVMQKDANTIAKESINIANTTSKTANESMSVLKYVITKFKDAPVITPIDDSKLLTYFDNIENDNELIEEFIYNKRHKILDKYIGDVLIKIYKKDNPAEQSIWNSDTQRLNYIIRKLIDTDPSWVIDKKGIRVDKSIIKPPLKNIKNIINKYIIENSTPEKTQFYVENDSYNRIAKQLEILTSIVIEIDDGSLGDNIIKYIAPHFYLNIKDNTLKIEK